MFTPLNVHCAASSAMHTAFANAARRQGRATPERSLGDAATAMARTCALAVHRGMLRYRQALLRSIWA